MGDTGSSPSNNLSPNLEGEHFDRRVDETYPPVPPTDEMEMDSLENFDFRTDETELETPSEAELESNEEMSDVSSVLSATSKSPEYFMQKFKDILSWIMKHESTSPFLKPVDAVASGQANYYEVIRKPMDLGTILSYLEAQEGSSRYKNMNDICADVRLVFTNAMQYNAPGSPVHTKAQILSFEFEKMWYPLSCEVGGEVLEMCWDFDEERKKEIKMRYCRNLIREEKDMLSDNMGKLSEEDIKKALVIAAPFDPKLDPSSSNVDIDLDSLDVLAQWMPYHFVVKCTKGGSASDGENIDVLLRI